MEVSLSPRKLGPWILPLLFLCKVDIPLTDGCPNPVSPGACATAVSSTDSSSQNEQQLSAGTCDFNKDLCQYLQECRDTPISNWIAINGGAQVFQYSGCGDSYSILQSPLLNFDTPACMEFYVRSLAPATLDVFLVLKNGTVKPVHTGVKGEQEDRTHRYTLEPSQSAKLKFRARGGGGSTSTPYSVRLDYIYIRHGRCEELDCYFDNNFCGWSVNGWSRASSIGNLKETSGTFAYVNTSGVQAQMTTTLTTSSGSVDCLEFQFFVSGFNTTLSVVYRPLKGPRVRLWSIMSYGTESSQSWSDAAIPVESSVAYQIDFESSVNGTHGTVAVDSVHHKRKFSCSYAPTSLGLDYHLVTNPQPIFTTIPSGSHGPYTTNRNPASTTDDDSSQDNTAAIAGSVAAVVVVVLIIIGVVIWRKRKSSRGKTNKEPTKQAEEHARGLSHVHDPDYSYATDTELNSNKPYIDPYELADDGAPGKTRGLVSDEYNVLNVHGVGKDLHNPHGADNDNYSHISSQSTELDVSVLYSQVQKKGKGPANKQQPAAAGPDPDAVYSQVQKTGKGAATPQHLTAADAALYSQVQKKGKKPLTAQKPGVAQKPAVGKKPTATDDYNRINFSESQPAGSADGVLDTYNRLEDVNV